MTSEPALVQLWFYEKEQGIWNHVAEYESPVVPRIGETISNRSNSGPGFRKVVGIDYLFPIIDYEDPLKNMSPIVSVYLVPTDMRGGQER